MLNNGQYTSFMRRQNHVPTSSEAHDMQDISEDLSWIDLLKGIAITSVFFGNWTGYFLSRGFGATHNPIYSFPILLRTAIGPNVFVFFVLSGLGLTLGYLERCNLGWSWKRWAWRRITKIIVPYYIFIILSFFLGIIGSIIYESVDVQFSWTSLITYLTFTRNFYPPGYVWNPPLWYMPVIIGLYAIFPLLLVMLKKWGPVKLLLISILITYTSLIIAFAVGATGSHASDFFLSWTFQFTLGILLGYIRFNKPEKLRLLIGVRAFIIGATFYIFSWILRTYIPYGGIFNDSVSSIGVFLILLNLGWGIRNIFPAIGQLFVTLSKQSFFIYLIHYPVMAFLIAPFLPVAMHPIVIVILGGLFILAMYYLCSTIYKPINTISSKLLTVFVDNNR